MEVPLRFCEIPVRCFIMNLKDSSRSYFTGSLGVLWGTKGSHDWVPEVSNVSQSVLNVKAVDAGE